MSENKELQKEEQTTSEAAATTPENEKTKKKVSLAEFKMKSFVTNVKVDQMQFLKTAGG